MNYLFLFVVTILLNHFCYQLLKQMNDDEENKDKITPFYLKLALVPPFGLVIEVFLVSLGSFLILHESLTEYLSKK